MEDKLAAYRARKRKSNALNGLFDSLFKRRVDNTDNPADMAAKESRESLLAKSSHEQSATSAPLIEQPTDQEDSTNDSFDWRNCLSLTMALKCLLWLILWGLFIELQFGAVYFVISLLYVIYANTRKGGRRDGKPSAYSVFNPNCERIDGTFTAEQFEKELRFGAMSVH